MPRHGCELNHVRNSVHETALLSGVRVDHSVPLGECGEDVGHSRRVKRWYRTEYQALGATRDSRLRPADQRPPQVSTAPIPLSYELRTAGRNALGIARFRMTSGP